MNKYVESGVLAVLCLGLSRWCDASPPAKTAVEIRNELRHIQQQIRSFAATYELASEASAERPLGDLLHREVAMLEPGYILHLNAHGNSRVQWSDDLRAQRTLVTPTNVTTDWLRSRAYSVWNWDLFKEQALPGSLPLESFFRTTGIWPLDLRVVIKSRNGVPYPLRSIAEDDSYQLGDPPTEIIDGRDCYVLVRGQLDKVWLDPGRGCALMARELYREQSAVRLERFELSDHVELEPEIWLPRHVRHVRFDPDRDTETVLVDFTYEVKEWRLNQLTPEAFKFQPRPGELWLNPPDKLPRQMEAGVDDYLDDVAAWVTRNGFSRTGNMPAAPMVDRISVLLFLAAGVLWFGIGRCAANAPTPVVKRSPTAELVDLEHR